MSLDRVGRIVLVGLTLLALLTIATSAVLRIAADDLYVASDHARGAGADEVRTGYGIWLSAHLSTSPGSADPRLLHAQADQLGSRSDRLRELAAVPAVIGLIVALLSDVPDRMTVGQREATQAAANTTSNGTA
jgi:hypothetical protein